MFNKDAEKMGLHFGDGLETGTPTDGRHLAFPGRWQLSDCLTSLQTQNADRGPGL